MHAMNAYRGVQIYGDLVCLKFAVNSRFHAPLFPVRGEDLPITFEGIVWLQNQS